MNLETIKILKDKVNQSKPVVQKREKRSEEELILAALEKDKKMDRSRKTPTKLEKQQLLFDKMVNYKEVQEETPKSIKKSDDEWDVKIGDPIEYFDPELSYELTGYRPITADKGLDFDPKLFTEAADNYINTGRYTQYMPNTFKWINFWQEEFNRCLKGFTVGKYTLTGQNYFFLNYYRLLSPLKKKDDSGSKRSESFPVFIAKQYEYFHYLEMCKKADFDGLAFKSRGVGASEIAASNCAHAYTFIKESYNIVTGFLEKYVRTTLRKVWQELDFLNTKTEGAFKRLRMKTNTDLKKTASLVDAEGNESGWKSTIEGITADTPDKLRGDRVDNIYFEESGNNKSLIETYSRGHALVDILGSRVGNRFVFGCVCKGTKVWTRTGEYKNIEDLHQVDGIIGFKDGKANIEPISYMQEEAYKPCVRITFRDGTFLECSEDHPILMRTLHRPRNKKNRNKRDKYFTWDFVPAKDVGSYQQYNIAGMCRTVDIFGTDTLFDPYLVGLLIGDGTYGYDNTPCLSNCDPEVLDYVKSKYKWSLNAEHITKDNKLYQEIRIKGICPELRKIGIYGQTRTKKRLPECYQTLDKENARQLIAGLFDTDGYISKTEPAAVLYLSTREILEQVQILLYKFGVYATINKIEPDIRPDRKDKNPWYALHIREYESFYNFATSIPLRIGYKKQALLTQHHRSDKHEVAPGIREVTVAKVESIGVLRIYNLTACDSHTYLANNVITHNTSGEQGPQLAGLKTMFFNPKGYSMLPYMNRSMLGEPLLTGYFIPSYSMWLGNPVGTGFDDRGVVYQEAAKQYYLKKWEKIDDPKALIIDKAEYCFTPEDAFVLEGSNNFDQEKLAEQKAAIEIHKTIPLPRQMQLRWQIKENQVDYDQRPTAQVGEGPIRFTEMPICDEHGIPFKNLYVIGVDGIDQGTNESSGQTDVSKFAIVVYRRLLGLQEPKIVAVYKERPRHIKDAWDICLKLAMFYNAKVLIEYTKISVVHHFKNVGKEHYLMHKPQGGQAGGGRRTVNRQIGVTPTQAVIEHYLELIENYIVDYYQFIDYTDLLDELISYSYENKRKFDLVAAFGMALLADEELRGRPARANSVQETLSLGYTRNEHGQVKLNNTKWNELTQFDYSRGSRFKFY